MKFVVDMHTQFYVHTVVDWQVAGGSGMCKLLMNGQFVG
jgi:hypothetical protein